MQVNHRDSERFKFQDCLKDAENNLEKAVFCTRRYIEEIRENNDKMVEMFKKEHASYM